MEPLATAAVDLYWIPLGAGGHCVRLSGRVFEAIDAARTRRERRDLYHAALVVELGADRYTIEIAPSPNADEASRGVVATGAVGSRHLGRLRCFRYEVRCWRGDRSPISRTPSEGHGGSPPSRRPPAGSSTPSRSCSGALPQAIILIAGIPFNATLWFFGANELMGHLPIYAAMLAVLVYGSDPGSAPPYPRCSRPASGGGARRWVGRVLKLGLARLDGEFRVSR